LKFLFSKDICAPYDIRRVFIARHREEDRKSKGFGFVTFRLKKHAELAMEKLNGMPLDDLLLSIGLMHFLIFWDYFFFSLLYDLFAFFSNAISFKKSQIGQKKDKLSKLYKFLKGKKKMGNQFE